MKRDISKLLFALGLALIMVPQSALTQNMSETTKRVINEARRTNPALRVNMDPQTGMPTRIRGLRPIVDPAISLGASRDASGAPSEADIRKSVEAFFSTGELSAAFAARNPRTKVLSTKVRKDPDIPTQSVVHVEQRVDGIPVFGSSARVIVGPSLAVTQLSANFSSVAIENTTPSITKDQAIETTRSKLGKILNEKHGDKTLERLEREINQVSAKATLVIFDPDLTRARGAKPGPTRLSWLTAIDDFRFFIDAQNGNVLFYYLDRRHAMPRRVYDLNQSFEFPGTEMIDEASGLRLDALPEDAQKAFINAGNVRDFYAQVLGRETVLATGHEGNIESYVRYGDIKNAYWCVRKSSSCPTQGVMVYGSNYATALDIAGHEITHGIISEEADLIYAKESGAVNEALADIFGTLIENQREPSTSNWVIGEQLPGFSTTSPLRNLANPNLSDKDGNSLFDKTKPFSATNLGQPDHYDDFVLKDDPICETTSDFFNGCVHINSGIFNKFAFLIAEGGRHRGLVVKGIGLPKLERIAYRALTTQLTESSGMIDSAEGFWASCAELAQAQVAGITSSDCDKVRQAQTAVGLFRAGS